MRNASPTTVATGGLAELIAPYPPGIPVLAPGELVTAVFPVRTFDTEEYLVMVTRRGIIKGAAALVIAAGRVRPQRGSSCRAAAAALARARLSRPSPNWSAKLGWRRPRGRGQGGRGCMT